MSENSQAAREPTTEEILEEARRRVDRRAEHRPSPPEPQELSPAQRRFALRLNRMVFWLSKHWLALFNVLAGAYIGGALLAPALMEWGYEGGAQALYRFYGAFCHQYPFRSWFLFGPRAAYPAEGALTSEEMDVLRAFLGSPTHGYKIALCQRDVAIYGIIFLAGLLYALLRRRLKLRPLPLWAYLIVGVAPMGLDGGLQLLTTIVWWVAPHLINAPYESSPLSRTVTGALFGLGSVAVVYPYMQEFFADVRTTLGQRYGWS
jgi:uncharacterized membrane protein